MHELVANAHKTDARMKLLSMNYQEANQQIENTSRTDIEALSR